MNDGTTVIQGGRSDDAAPERPQAEIVNLTPEVIKDMREKRVIRDMEAEIELPAFGPGDEKIGVLTEEERALYIEIMAIEADIDDHERELQARSLTQLGQHIREEKDRNEAVKKWTENMIFSDEAEAEVYFEMFYRKDYLNSMLWYNVRRRLGVFGSTMAVRYGFAIVQRGLKYKGIAKPEVVKHDPTEPKPL